MGFLVYVFVFGMISPLFLLPLLFAFALKFGIKLNRKWVSTRGMPEWEEEKETEREREEREREGGEKEKQKMVLIAVNEKQGGGGGEGERVGAIKRSGGLVSVKECDLSEGARQKGLLDVKVASTYLRYFCILKNHRLYCLNLDPSTPKCLAAVVIDRGVTVKLNKKSGSIALTAEKGKEIIALIGPNGEQLCPIKSKGKVTIRFEEDDDVLQWNNAILAEIENPDAYIPPLAASSSFSSSSSTVPSSLPSDDNDDDDEEVDLESDSSDDESISSSSSSSSSSSALDSEGEWLYLFEEKTWRRFFFRLSVDYNMLTYCKSGKSHVEKSRNDKDIVGMIDLNGCEISKGKALEGRELCILIDHPEKRRIFLPMLPGSKRKLTKSVSIHANTSQAIISVHNAEQLSRWMTNLSRLVKLSVNRENSQQVPNIPDDVPANPVPFLNVFLDRLFRDMRDSKLFYNDIYTTLVNAFGGINKPEYVAPITVEKVELGSSFIVAHSAKMKSFGKEMVAELDLEYTGGLGLDISTGLYIGTSNIPVKVKVRIMQVAGKAQLYAGKESQCRWWFFFATEPLISVSINITVGKGSKGTLTILPQLKRFIENAARGAIINAFVWPSKITLNIPIPGKKLEPKVEVVSSTVRSEHAPPPPPVPATTRVKPSTDATANGFLVRRFFEKVLSDSQANYESLLPEMFASYAQIIGTDPLYDRPLVGREGVKLFSTSLRRAFPDVTFEIVDLQCESSNVIIQFKAVGTHLGPWWGKAPLQRKVSLLGCVSSRVTYAKIVTQMWFWSPESIILFA